MIVNQLNLQQNDSRDVAAAILAMTNKERPFLRETVKTVLSDAGIGQVLLCVEKNNSWLEETIGTFIEDPRLQIIRLPLMPPGAIRNRAVDRVEKPWVAFCDGDDLWCKNKTLIQTSLADRLGCDFIAADHYLTDEAGTIRAVALSRSLPMLSSWMVRTEIMRQHPFDETLYQSEDGEWWNRTARVLQKVRCSKLLLRYRVRSESLSSGTPSKQRKAKIVALAKVPVLKWIVLFLTYCAWFLTRRNKYV